MNRYLNILSLSLILGFAGCNDSSSFSPRSGQAVAPSTQRGLLAFVVGTQEGYKLATQKHKPCLLFFTADWCTYCHRMEETAFASDSVASLSKQFVCVIVDADREAAVCQEFGVTGFPTVQFVSAKGQQLHRLVGMQSPSELVQGMQLALERTAWMNQAESQLR